MRLALASVQLVMAPVDGRMGAEGLSQYIQNTLGISPCSGVAYVFTNRRHTRLKATLIKSPNEIIAILPPSSTDRFHP
jgi:hypothetical protein